MEISWVSLISQVGVPSAIAFFILIKIDKTLAKVGEALNRLSKLVSHCHYNDYPKTI